ncbi:MAG: hypothetical protein LUD72_13785 [Bacteroidales bacterium]|nr:hypothetical protein [Bacteroidales bacterium]
MHLCVTLDANAYDPASLLAASLVAARLRHVWGQFVCTAFCDPTTNRVRLAMHADFDDVEEAEWSCALSEGMEGLWSDDGGVEDYRKALELVREDVVTQLSNWLEERAEELDMNLVLSAAVSIHDFNIRQK